MKKILLMLFSATLLLVGGGCNDEYDDSALSGRVDDLENRVAQLEELCNRMNTNIVALRQIVDAFQEADYVTAIVPMVDGGVTIGYRISFAKSDPVIIYHGQDGKDGADGKDGQDGKDGYTPSIGVRQDADGKYYWTLDGEWLTDAAGNRIQASAADGKDGEDGQDGVSPRLKIEEGYWYISYDGGQNWTKLDKAAGEDGGDSIFKAVEQDDANVYFTLQDGTVITISKSLTALVEKINSIEFVPRYSDGRVAMVRQGGKSFAEFDFQISPKSVVAEIEQIWESAVSMQAVYTQTRAVDFVELPVAEFAADAQNGVVTVKVSGENLSAAFFAGEVEASAVLTVSDSDDSTSSAYVPMIAEDKGGAAASYESWLGTWRVKSTSSEVNGAPVTFEVTISQKDAGSTYNVSGWGIAYYREDVITGYYDAQSGAFYLMDGNVYEYDSQYYYVHIGRIYDPADGKYYLWGDSEQIALTATLQDERSATVVGSQVEDDFGTYTINGLDFFAYRISDGAYLSFNPADGYTSGDYPIGPYSMTKTADAPDPSQGPTLEVSLRPGDGKGENTDTYVYFQAKSPEAVAAKILNGTTAQFETLLASYTMEELMAQAGRDLTSLGDNAISYLNTGLGLTLSGCTPGTSYTVALQVTDAAGNSVIKSAEASTTGSAGPLSLTVTVENVTDEGADITVKPSNGTDTYYFDYYESAELEGMSDAQIISALKSAYKGAIPASVMSTGVDGYDADYFLYSPLDANTEYTVIAFGFDVDTQEMTTSSIVRESFKTLPEGSAQPLALDVKIDQTADPIPGGVTATITPSDKDATYMLDFVLADEVAGMSDAQIIQYVEEKYSSMGVPMYYLITSGNYTTYPTDFRGSLALIPGADYYLVAYGHDGSAPTSTTLAKAKCTTGVHPNAANTTFEFVISDITQTQATVTVNPSIEPVTFMYDIFNDEDWTDIGGANGIASYYPSLFSYYGQMGFTGTQIISILGGWYSGTEYTFAKLTPGAHYNVVAIACDLNGRAVGKASVGEFTMEAPGEATEAYNAWIGTWSVKSASSFESEAPITFDLSIAAKINNVSYEVTGLGISELSKSRVVEAQFDVETGGLVLKSQQASFNANSPEGTLPVWYCGICPNGTGCSFVRGDYPALTATGNGSIATMVGNDVTVSGGVVLTVASMDFAAFGSSLYTFSLADGYTSDDYPTAPFAMTKTAATPAPAYAKAATMSSVLTSAYLGGTAKKAVAASFAPKMDNRNTAVSSAMIEARKQQLDARRAAAPATRSAATQGSLKSKTVGRPMLKSALECSFEAAATTAGSPRAMLSLGREEAFKKGIAVR